MAAELAGRPTAEVVQLGLEYDPEPTFDNGSLSKVAPEIVQAAGRHTKKAALGRPFTFEVSVDQNTQSSRRS